MGAPHLPSSSHEPIRNPSIVVVGTIPPPVTGMTLVTEQVVLALQRAGPIKFFNWSTGISRRGFVFRATRTLRILGSLFWLLGHGRVQNARLYIVANSKEGLYLTVCFVWLARRLGYAIYLHHHTYYYIDVYDWRAAWIHRMMGDDGVHVVHTLRMAADFMARYGTGRFACVYPSVVAAPLKSPRDAIHTPIRLGMLSNLSLGKGLDLALETFNRLRHEGYDARLSLAGQYLTQEARTVVEQAVAESEGRIEYLGPVYGDNKARFFEQIDCFLFPTRSESWGIVLHESMAAGVPVITYDRGCTRTVVGEQAGLVIDPDANFPEQAARQIECWADHTDKYRSASIAAIDQADMLQREGRRMLDEFAANMHQPAPL